MSYAYYLDDDYLKIQDFVGVLSDSLPRLVPSKLNNPEALIKALVDQNKAYGRKIISLFESIDSIYKQTTANRSPDVSSRSIERKVRDYENTIKTLSEQNDDFSSQIKQLTKQMENVHVRFSLPSQHSVRTSEFTVTDARSPKGQQTSPFQVAKSPIQPQTSARQDLSQDKLLVELESSFAKEQYTRAAHFLAQLDYRKPNNISTEKFTNWLCICNRLKDSQLNDILNKIKLLITFAGDGAASNEPLFHDNDDSTSGFDKAIFLLDDKLPKILLKNEYELKDEGSAKGSKVSNENNFTSEQLLLKVEYLNNQLKEAQQQIGNKDVELRVMKERIRDKDTALHHQRDTSPERDNEGLVKAIEREVRLRIDAEQRLQDASYELKILREKVEGIDRELQVKQRLVNESQSSRGQHSDLVNKLMRENAKLREQCEFSENLEDIEKFKEQLIDKEAQIRALTEELTEIRSTYRKSPERDHLRSTEKSVDYSRRFTSDVSTEPFQVTSNYNTAQASHIQKSGSKSQNLAIENALHSQATTIHSVVFTLSQITSALQSVVGKEKIYSPSRHTQPAVYSDKSEENPAIGASNEVQRVLRSNHSTLQQIQAEAATIRTNVESLVATKKLDDRDNTLSSTNLVDKIAYAEESFLNNMSTCFQTLAQLTALLQNLPADVQPSVFLPQTLNQLQTLHSNMNKAFEDFPDFSVEKDQRQGKGESTAGSPHRPRNTIRDRLLRDQGDLTRKLRQSMLSLEKQQTNDAFVKLNQEIEKSQDLLAKLESRDHLIHRLSLLISEGLDRTVNSLAQLLKLADSSEAQTFLNFIASEISHLKNKFGELTTGSVKESGKHMVELKEDFERQKQSWSKNISDFQATLEDKNGKLIKEIEAERQAHEETVRRLKEIQNRYREQEDLEVQIKVLRRDLAERDTKLEQKTSELKKSEQLVLEHEILQKENQTLKNKNLERGEEVSQRELHIRELKDELHAIKRDVGELNRTRDDYRALNDYKSKAEVTIRKNAETVDQMRSGYIKEIEQLRDEMRELNQIIDKLKRELDRKSSTVSQMNETIDPLHDKLSKQADNLRAKEAQCADLLSQLKEIEREKKDLKSQVEELSLRSNKYAEHLDVDKEDLMALQNELRSAMMQQNDNQKDLNMLRKKNEELASQNKVLSDTLDRLREEQYELEERIVKLNEIIEITKADCKQAKENLETKIQDLMIKEREINRLHEILRKEKGNEKDRELLVHLRQEINTKNHDINTMRSELQSSIHKNDRMNMELENLKSSHKLTSSQRRELDKLSGLNGGLSNELENIRKNLKHKDEMHHLEKAAYEREMQILQKKLTDLHSILDEKDHQIKNMPKSFFSPSESANSRSSAMSGNSSFYAGLIENKDMEIKRLTQIVRNLTENLKDTQETKYKLRKH